ncbi:type II toxin-antitoxin system VapC family toxin [Dyadobacter sp. OTU695]|uniref:type II toxin-antitoxin system VapC family toxin n=1 Tax=Dyadobacter sp. OTU695 TaxID=3043860 RepID=UPI00313DAAC2
MRLFLDTSSLIKLYHEEPDSKSVDAVLDSGLVSSIILSDLSRVELLSALWKKRRTGELTDEIVREIIYLFDQDASQYKFVPITEDIIEDACNFLSKYGVIGLRSLDSIQLATAIALKQEADLFLTSDTLLKSLLKQEQLRTDF